MDVVKNILDWFSENSRNLSESQKKEVYDLLNSLEGRCKTQMGPSSRDHLLPHFPHANRRDQKYHGGADEIDREAEFESKINRVTNIVNKESGYINGKLDTITREYNEQIEKLRNKVSELENKSNQRKQEVEKEVSDEDINRLAENLKDLMTGIVTEPRSFPSNLNPIYPQGPPPPYQPSPPMVPNSNIPYFPPPHIPPQFHPRPPFPHSHFGPSSSNPTPNDMNHQGVYRFSAKWGYAPNTYANRGAGHSKPRFEKTFPRENDDKFGGNVKKSYCSSWKKFDHKNKDQGFKNEPLNTANVKSQYKTTLQDEQSSGDSNRGRSCQANRFKNHTDRGKNKRFQQFGKNRPQNQDDGFESDTSVGSHVSSQNTRKEFSHKAGYTHKFKAAPNKNPQTVADKNDDSNLSKHENKRDKDNPTTSGKFLKHVRKDYTSKTQPSGASSTTPSKCPQSSTEKPDSSELQKLKYPSKAVALRQGIDIRKSLESPGMCLGKRNGVPVSRSVYCLEDIYNFEIEFGSCQVIRF